MAEMRTIGKVAGLCLASMLVMGMALAGNASAESTWLLCLEGSNAGNTKYEDSSCTKAKSTGKWESVALGTKSDTVKLQAFTILLMDTKATGGASGVRCDHPTAGWGVIENTNELIVRAAKVESPKTECERVEGGCKAGEVEKVVGVDLPWRVELSGGGEGVIGTDGGGEPGWEIECNTILGKKNDICEGESVEKNEKVELENRVVAGILLVLGAFAKKSKAKCSQGGAESGEVAGQLAVSLSTGSGLSVLEKGPRVIASPSLINYKKVAINTAATAVVTYTNKGPGAWLPPAFGFIKLKGEITAWRPVLGAMPCNMAVPEGGKCEEIIEFEPKKREAIEAVVVTKPVSQGVIVRGEGV